MNIAEYYKNEFIQKRIAEYCGGKPENPQNFTAQYLVGYGVKLLKTKNIEFMSAPKEYFTWILENELDIYRSVWDIGSTLGVLDIEYFNLDKPALIYTNPEEIFHLMEPVYQKILQVFKRFKINPLPIMTGQGYHFSFKVSRYSPADKSLEKIGYVSATLKEKYKTVKGRRKRPVSIRHGKAFEGMGKILEFLTHIIIKELAEENFQLPCVITDVAIGKSKRGMREAISFDLSMYGDPIYMRDIRTPFSTHQKHKIQWWKVGKYISETIPPRIAVPRKKITLDDALKIRKDLNKAIELAKKTSCKIPDVSKTFKTVVSAYKKSALYKIHKSFDETEIDEPSRWAKTYYAINLAELPPCINHCLLFPNDHLLKPTNLQNLTRTLMSKGWHPKHIAGLVTSRYQNPQYNWHENWNKYDPSSRANFYVRIFSDLIKTGLDRGLDFNCISQKEKGYCLKEWCGWNLEEIKFKI